MKESVYAVILAGGHGTRFWPRSRKKRPKQFLDIVGSDSMIQQTVSRIEPLIPAQNIIIVTNTDQADMIREHLPEIEPENILAEPCGKNTAPALALAASYLMDKDPDSTMVVLTADHLIQKRSAFLHILRQGIAAASTGRVLITLGIRPTVPETGYGYIQMGEKGDNPEGCFSVKRFVEKPDKDTARDYLAHGGYLWNSGMFIWKTHTFWRAMEKLMPMMYQSFCLLKGNWGKDGLMEKLERVYAEAEAISVDYGIMEKAANVLVIPADIGWNDVGSWTALDQVLDKSKDGNIIRGPHICIDTKNIIAHSPKKLFAAIGIEDLIIVETEDAILVCHKDRAQDLKRLVNKLEEEGLHEYL